MYVRYMAVGLYDSGMAPNRMETIGPQIRVAKK